MLKKISKRLLKKELEYNELSSVINKYGLEVLLRYELVKCKDTNLYYINDNRKYRLYSSKGEYLGTQSHDIVRHETKCGKLQFSNGYHLLYRIIQESKPELYSHARPQYRATYGIVDRDANMVIDYGQYFQYARCKNGLVLSGINEYCDNKAIIITRDGEIIDTAYDVVYPIDVRTDDKKFYRVGKILDEKMMYGTIAVDADCNIIEVVPCNCEEVGVQIVSDCKTFRLIQKYKEEILLDQKTELDL